MNYFFPLQKVTNKIVSDILLQEVDQEPSIGISYEPDDWIYSSIDFFSEE